MIDLLSHFLLNRTDRNLPNWYVFNEVVLNKKFMVRLRFEILSMASRRRLLDSLVSADIDKQLFP